MEKECLTPSSLFQAAQRLFISAKLQEPGEKKLQISQTILAARSKLAETNDDWAVRAFQIFSLGSNLRSDNSRTFSPSLPMLLLVLEGKRWKNDVACKNVDEWWICDKSGDTATWQTRLEKDLCKLCSSLQSIRIWKKSKTELPQKYN